MKNSTLCLIMSIVLAPLMMAQNTLPQIHRPDESDHFGPITHSRTAQMPSRSFYKSKSEWQHIIDSTWGMGMTLAEKLQLFDAYASLLTTRFDGFKSLGMNWSNWDSLRNRYRSKIDSSTSRGRFAAIMNYLALSLRDVHTYALDTTVVLSSLVPGTPVLVLHTFPTDDHFGATLSVLPDSSAIVLRTVLNHPLGLQPGDVILGYEGVPWRRLLPELLDAEIPVFARGTGSLSADIDSKLRSVGLNWHLFDTIDVVKYTTKDTVHLSVSPLLTLPTTPMLNNEQLEIPGVPFPTYSESRLVISGVISGSNIGYIYLLSHTPNNAADPQLRDAVKSLLNTDGLIIDMRHTMGGWSIFDEAFAMLFNETFHTIVDAYRAGSSSLELVSMDNAATYDIHGAHLYDRPIAVLLGPTCWSMGDCTAHRLRSHPMIRFFGKSPTSSLGDNIFLTGYANWTIRYSIGDMFLSSKSGEYLNRREFPIDDPVWFNQNDVAKGDDTVVKDALHWIANLSYGHDVKLNTDFGEPAGDTIKITATIENPQKHALDVWSYLNVKDSTTLLVDSCQMFDDGMHSDGKSGDNIYGGNVRPSVKAPWFGVSLRTTDLTSGTFRHLPRARRYFTAGPVICSGWINAWTDTIPNPGDELLMRFNLVNSGRSDTVKNVTATISVLDTTAYILTVTQIPFGNLAPGQQSLGTKAQKVTIQTTCPLNREVRLLVNISTEGTLAWTDTVSITVQAPTGVMAHNNTAPTEYSLGQNYPNPFNPATVISYELAVNSVVTLKIFDLVGRGVATLVNEKKDAGRYSVQWDASGFASGIYFYRLEALQTERGRAGNYVATKKLVLLR